MNMQDARVGVVSDAKPASTSDLIGSRLNDIESRLVDMENLTNLLCGPLPPVSPPATAMAQAGASCFGNGLLQEWQDRLMVVFDRIDAVAGRIGSRLG